MPSLREFWFPLLLTVASLLPAAIGASMTDNGRRVMWSISAALVFAGVLSFIWGDPVRGPFAHLVRKLPDDFVFDAGMECHYPIKNLAEGIDLSSCIRFGQEEQPIQLWVKKTWWSGLKAKVTVLKSPDQPALILDNMEIKYLEPGGDLNSDEYAIEMVTPRRVPIFQLILSKDYKVIYLNAVLEDRAGNFTVFKDRSFLYAAPEEVARRPENRLDRIFKYPSYLYPGERD